MLFDPDLIDANKVGPAALNEGVYKYLATANNEVSQRVRGRLNEWFAGYPEDERWEMAQRIKSSGREFDSELFELLMYSTLRQRGFNIQIHPDLPDDVDKKPDFLVTDANGNLMYLECVLARGESDREAAAQNLLNGVYQKINEQLRTPELYWSVRLLSQTAAAPRAGQIVYSLVNWQRELDREALPGILERNGVEGLPKHLWEQNGWSVEFTPLPKDPAKLDVPHRPLGIFQGDAVIVDDEGPILKAADFKAGRYGENAYPYAIAISATGLFAELMDFHDALFPSGVGRPGGFWKREDGTLRNQNVNAIIGVAKCRSDNFGAVKVCVFNNPFVEAPAIMSRLPYPKRQCTEQGYDDLPGESISTILELPAGWPRPEVAG
ncbi:MAG: hypothetical protein GC165_00140 [Armatimonadetes bacterium]|nr:hypothetical protein [Armatimonadota bacterium]